MKSFKQLKQCSVRPAFSSLGWERDAAQGNLEQTLDLLLSYSWRNPRRGFVPNCADTSGDFFGGRWKQQVVHRANKMLQSEILFWLSVTAGRSKPKDTVEGR